MNKQIILATVIIAAAGAYYVILIKPTGSSITKVLVGAYMTAILASIADLVSPETSAIAGGLMMLAVVTALFVVLPDMLSRITQHNTAQATSAPTSGSGSGSRTVR